MRKVALLGGVSYLIIFLTAIFANFFVIEAHKVVGDPAVTYTNFKSNQGSLWLAVLALALTVVFDILLSWVFYTLFKVKKPKLAKVTALFRLVYSLIFAAAIFHLVDMAEILSNDNITESQGAKDVYRSLMNFGNTWLFGLILFGIHLCQLSYLICKTHPKMKITSGLLMLAGLGYVGDSCLQFFYSDYSSIAHWSVFIVVLPGIIGELSLTGWLLFKAGREKELKGQRKLSTAS